MIFCFLWWHTNQLFCLWSCDLFFPHMLHCFFTLVIFFPWTIFIWFIYFHKLFFNDLFFSWFFKDYSYKFLKYIYIIFTDHSFISTCSSFACMTNTNMTVFNNVLDSGFFFNFKYEILSWNFFTFKVQQ